MTQIAGNRISVTVVERSPPARPRPHHLRRWTPTELDAAVRLAGGLEVVARHGSFDTDSGFVGAECEWRMISVLERSD